MGRSETNYKTSSSDDKNRSRQKKHKKHKKHKDHDRGSLLKTEKEKQKGAHSSSDNYSDESSRSSSPEYRSHSSSTHHKHRKHKKKSTSPEPKKKTPVQHKESRENSSKCDAEQLERLNQIENEKMQLKEDKRKQKEMLKAMETPEQKRLRRLVKKEAKERKRKEQMGWDEEYMGYTNTDNPFGDANLLKTFMWNKKLEKEGLKNISEADIEKRNKIKLEENRTELEKVKQRRLEREREREAREDEMTKIQRDKEAAQFKEWEKQEDSFHLQQAKMRSKIRIQDGRAKPIDLLARYISAEEEDLTVEMHEPYVYLNGLTVRDLEDLQEDIKVYMELENGKNLDYWRDLQIIVEDELHKLRRVDSTSIDHIGDRREGIHSSVSADVVAVFKSKTPSQLQILFNQIESMIHSGEEGVDIGYWESLQSRLKAYMARARLRERHQENLRRKLFQLKQEQGVESGPLFPCVTSSPTLMPPPPPPPPDKRNYDSLAELEALTITTIKREHQELSDSGTANEQEQDDAESPKADLAEEIDPIKISEEEYLLGAHSPQLIQMDSLEPGTLLTDPEEDAQRLEFIRRRLIGTGHVEDVLTSEEKAFEREARKGMDADEAVFSVESPVDKTYLWSDKYRPRKPRYFNRVHTGFEWNKYNQTHYDMDNPPPKIVQGYKFNIFYPDLIDKAKTPEYTLTPCDDNKDFAVLRFSAGPPYEDIAFKIVNREWEYSYKRGFRCQFHNNIFQLWFHFKRYRYRR